MPDISSTLSAAASDTHMKFGLSTLKRGMDMEKSQIAQLLQAMPQAPQPSHLGRSVDMRA